MKTFLKLLLFSVITLTFSCSKYRNKTPYRIEVTTAGSKINSVQWDYRGSGVSGKSETWWSETSHLEKEFTGTSKCTTSVRAVCFDDGNNPQLVTVKIFRKNKLVKEGSGSGEVTVEYNTL